MSRFILRLRVPLGFLFAAWYLVVARPASWLHLLACAIPVFFGCALRFWAAGYLFKGKRVAVGGPYAYVRNPLYLGSFILGLGELKSALGTDYERYAARVPRFVPRAHAVKGLGEQHFSAELYRRNREYQCILGCAAVLAYLAVRYAFAF
jgi:protein-S-isoprenylcysteine O-methyltransferase Ste14